MDQILPFFKKDLCASTGGFRPFDPGIIILYEELSDLLLSFCFPCRSHAEQQLPCTPQCASLAERFYILGKNTFLIYKKIAPKKGRDKSRYHPVSCYLNNRHSDCVTCRDVVFYFIFKNAAHVGNSFPA